MIALLLRDLRVALLCVVPNALPLLAGADVVDVISVNPKERRADHGDVPGADMCLHLARHGVKAQAQHVAASDIDVGNLLLSRLALSQATINQNVRIEQSEYELYRVSGYSDALLKRVEDRKPAASS